MSEVTVTKPINVGQLSHELGHPPLRVVGPDESGTYDITSDIDQALLQSGVDAHTADLNWVHPDPQPPPIQFTNEQNIREALRNGLAQLVSDRNNFATYTAQQRAEAQLRALRALIGLVRLAERILDSE